MNDYVKSETSQFYYKKVLLPNTCWGLYDSCAVVLSFSNGLQAELKAALRLKKFIQLLLFFYLRVKLNNKVTRRVNRPPNRPYSLFRPVADRAAYSILLSEGTSTAVVEFIVCV